MYISCKVDKLPLFNIKYDQHITLMYDTRNKDFGLPDFVSGEAEVIGWDYLGENFDSLVLILKSDYLENYHNLLLDLGYRHSFDSLLLHTTIFYDIVDSIKPFYEVIAETMIGKKINFHTINKEILNN